MDNWSRQVTRLADRSWWRGFTTGVIVTIIPCLAWGFIQSIDEPDPAVESRSICDDGWIYSPSPFNSETISLLGISKGIAEAEARLKREAAEADKIAPVASTVLFTIEDSPDFVLIDANAEDTLWSQGPLPEPGLYVLFVSGRHYLTMQFLNNEDGKLANKYGDSPDDYSIDSWWLGPLLEPPGTEKE